MTGKRVLILSDGKPGHVNQSIAFARMLDLEYTVYRIAFTNGMMKTLSYLADRCGILSRKLFQVEGELSAADLVVSAGSSTYYANKVLAAQFGARSVAIMFPAGYRCNFDLVIAQQHDDPPSAQNIVALPVNISYPEPQGLVKRNPERPCVGLVIGGPSRHFEFDAAQLESQIDQIVQLFDGYDIWVTTSRRTPPEIDSLVESKCFQYQTIYSRDAVNPLADFWTGCDYVFVTEDSTSMISEAVCFGRAKVEVLPLPFKGGRNKVGRMVQQLADDGYLHLFDGALGDRDRKIRLKDHLHNAVQGLL